MARPRGYPKSGGRQKGTVNKTSLPVAELCELHGVSPIEVLIEYCKAPEPDLPPDKLLSRLGFRFQAAKELIQYIVPKKRALEVDANVNVELAKKAEEYGALPKEEQITLMEAEIKRLKGEL